MALPFFPPMGGDTSGLSTQEQLQDVQQQRALAQALITQASNQQGIHAGPFFIAPSRVGGLASVLGGALLSNKLAGQEKDLRAQRGKQLGDAFSSLLNPGANQATPPPPATNTAPAPADTPPDQSPMQGSVGTDDNGLPQVTVNAHALPDAGSAAAAAATPPAAQAPPAAPAAPAMDPTTARRAAAIAALQNLPIETQQQVLGSVAGAALTPPKPVEPFKLSPGESQFDANGNKIASAASLPMDEIAKLAQDHRNGLISDDEYNARKAMMTNPDVKWEDRGDVLIPLNAKTGQPIPGLKPIQKQMTPAQDHAATMFEGPRGTLLGALANKGVSLPAGFRSKEQQGAVLDGLWARNPGMSADDIADGVANGQIGFAADKKAATVAGGQAGKVAVGLEELKSFGPAALQASQSVPRGSFVPVTRLLQTADSAISDPALKNFKIRVNALLNAYDQVAARGGTDVGKREAAHALLTTADSPEAFATGVQAFMQEAELAEQAARAATHSFDRGTPGQPKAAAPNTKSLNGVTYVNVNGQWYQQ